MQTLLLRSNAVKEGVFLSCTPPKAPSNTCTQTQAAVWKGPAGAKAIHSLICSCVIQHLFWSLTASDLVEPTCNRWQFWASVHAASLTPQSLLKSRTCTCNFFLAQIFSVIWATTWHHFNLNSFRLLWGFNQQISNGNESAEKRPLTQH